MQSVSAGGSPPRIQRAHNVTPSLVQLETASPFEAQLGGESIVHLWNAQGVIEENDGSVTEYRSGSWTVDETRDPLTGRTATRKTAHQVLTLHLRDASGVLTATGAQARAVSEKVNADLTGSASLRGAALYLEAGRYYYALEQGDVTVEGQMTFEWAPGDSDHVLGDVAGELSQISLPPSGRLPPTTVSRSLPDWIALVLAIFLASVVLLPAAAVARRRSLSGLLIDRAEDTLVNGKSRRARRFASRILRSDPDDADAHFVRAASLVQGGRYAAVVDELESHAEHAKKGRHGLAFLLAYAHAKLGHERQALRWIRVAQEDPLLVEKVQMDPAFESLRKKAGYRRLAMPRVQDAAYA